MHPAPESFESLRFPVLLGDIGGTNARFSILVDAHAEPKPFPILATADFRNIDDAIQTGVLDRTSIQPRSAVLAVAAPIVGDEIDLTNSPWVVRPATLINELGLQEVVLINDFEAQALAIAALPESGRVKIGGGEAREGASRVVVGPGTGLGVAGLVCARHMWIPVAGEGGHVDIGPRTERDRAVWPHLSHLGGRVSAEEVLSGRGLMNLYRAVCAADGEAAVHAEPAAVTQGAVAGGDRAASEAVRLFTLYLGRVAGDLALVFMARGGVYIGGGIIGRIAPVLDAAALRDAFEEKPPHTDLMRRIPLFVITQPSAALTGLAAFARAPRLFGLETTGRCWVA